MNVTVNGRRRHFRTVSFDAPGNRVLLVEQRLLPHQFHIVSTRDYRATAAAIRDMVVRGAGALGATAAYGLAQGARAFRGKDPGKFRRHVGEVLQTLASARPTAVDPQNALMEVRARMDAGASVAEQQQLALDAAETFAGQNVEQCEAIGRHGAKLIRNGMNLLT